MSLVEVGWAMSSVPPRDYPTARVTANAWRTSQRYLFNSFMSFVVLWHGRLTAAPPTSSKLFSDTLF